jgi:hypothetical protein
LHNKKFDRQDNKAQNSPGHSGLHESAFVQGGRRLTVGKSTTLDNRPDKEAYPKQPNGKHEENEKESNQYFHFFYLAPDSGTTQQESCTLITKLDTAESIIKQSESEVADFPFVRS